MSMGIEQGAAVRAERSLRGLLRIRPSVRGFTLIEIVVVLVITGIIGAIVAVFLRAPIRQYTDLTRRVELSDIADTALRRVARDIRTAVPNSVRLPTPTGSGYVEFLPVRSGGRYRASPAGAAGVCGGVPGNRAGDALSFSVADTCFGIIGPAQEFAAGDGIVIGSTQSDGNPPYDASAAGVLRLYSGVPGTQAAVQIPAVIYPAFAELDSHRFFVVPGDQQAVTYACVGTLGTLDANRNGQARLMRYWQYGFQAAQVPPPSIVGGGTGIGGLPHVEAVMADRVSACNIKYEAINQRYGLLTLTLALTVGGESISLLHQIHVNNVP